MPHTFRLPWKSIKELPDDPAVWLVLDDSIDPQDVTGFLPSFVDHDDGRPLAEQLDANYQHGGGWRNQPGWECVDKQTMTMKYPEDPPLLPYVVHRVRDEFMFIYDMGYVAVVQLDGSFEMARMD